MYEIIKVLDTKFYFKKDLNPITNEYDYHIWIRHLVEPIEAITAYFNRDDVVYNEQNDRYEAFSIEDDMTVYYFYKNNKTNQVLVITAFRSTRE